MHITRDIIAAPMPRAGGLSQVMAQASRAFSVPAQPGRMVPFQKADSRAAEVPGAAASWCRDRRFSAGHGGGVPEFGHAHGDLQQAGGRTCDPVAVEFTLQIENWRSIAAAYGAAACDHARNHLISLLAELAAVPGLIPFEVDWISVEGDLLHVRLPGRRIADRARGSDRLRDLPVLLHYAAALRPFTYLGQSIHLALCCSPVGAAEEGFGSSSRRAAPQARETRNGDDTLPDDPDARRCRADMAEASKLLALVASDQLDLAWQAVCSTTDLWDVLYYEALLREVGEDPAGTAPFGAIRALERLGLVRVLDAHVVTKVLDQLEAHPGIILAANISARSATFDHWWSAIDRRLRERRDLACRLVIEITETAELSPSDATAFVDHMRSLGCRIALDDFGVGFASVRRLLLLSPDIVKIDSFFVRRASLSEREGKVFAHIVGLAGAIAPLVVVEGVETDDQHRLAESAGAVWFQGARGGWPGSIRSWMTQPGNRKGLASSGFRNATARDSKRGVGS